MLHHKERSSSQAKVLLLGGSGFIGRTLASVLKASGFTVDVVASRDLDLVDSSSITPLSLKVAECDHLVMLSCLTPDKGRGADALLKNILMAKHVCDAILQQENRPHVVYFSSDSVYNFDDSLIHEGVAPSPIDVYGAMHRTRELMFMEAVGQNLAILRPTLVYGPGDSHNSYGPNRFRREALREKSITVFGEGEDTRAHIFIDDLVKLATLVLQNNSVGVINAAPDQSITYGDLAKLVSQLFADPIELKKKPRAADPNHRYFETSRCYEAFPGFTFTPLKEGLQRTYEAMLENPDA